MQISKQNLNDISHLIFDGYIECDTFVSNSYVTLRTLRTTERNGLFERYKYFSKSYNFMLIVELLSISIDKIAGIKINDCKKVYNILLRCNSTFISFLYKRYLNLEKRVEEAIKLMDFYMESKDSKYYWNLYKNTSKNIDLHEIKGLNQFQYYWLVVNSFRDVVESEKREWSRVEYMTNSICAFVNPKAYRQVKNKMNVSDKIGQQFDNRLDARNRALAKLEGSNNENEIVEIQDDEKDNEEKGIKPLNKKVFRKLKRNKEESKEEYVERVNDTMKEQTSGRVLDEHDKIVRRYEMNTLKQLFIERRTKIEVSKNVRRKRRFATSKNMNELSAFKEDVAVIGEERDLEKYDVELKKKGFYHDGASYADIAFEKCFGQIPRVDKERLFKEAMEAEIDVEKATEVFLKDLYKDGNEEPEKEQVKNDIVVGLKEEADTFEMKDDVKKTDVEKAANMDVVVNSGKDLIKEKQKQNMDKTKRYQQALERRNQIFNKKKENNDDVDEIFFN